MEYKIVLHKIEEVSEDTAFTVGIVSLTIGPLIGPLLSGAILLIAFWDGLGRGLAAIGTVYPYSIALALGLIAMGVFESLSIGNMVLADRMRRLTASGQATEEDFVKATRNKNGLFVALLGLVCILEVAPAIWGGWTGSMDVVAVCARMATVVFPFVGRIAGSVFSQKKLADEIDPEFRLAAERRIVERKTLELKRSFTEEQLRLEHEHAKQLSEAKQAKALAKYGTITVAPTVATVAPTVALLPDISGPTTVNGNGATVNGNGHAGVYNSYATVDRNSATADHNSATVPSATVDRNSEDQELLRFIGEHPGCRASDLAGFLGVNKTTAFRRVQPLIDSQQVLASKNGQSITYNLVETGTNYEL